VSETSFELRAPQRSALLSGVIEARVRRALHERLARLSSSRVTWVEHGESQSFGSIRAQRQACIEIHSPRFYSALARGGSLGAASSFIDGDWTTPDLTALLRMVLAEPLLYSGLDGSLARAASFARRLLGLRERNTRSGSRRNIAAHYDLGNALFECMLDPSMTYSSAIFAPPEATLEQAQSEKLDRICRRIGLAPGHRVLEIGTGWGSFALHAAANYGAQVTTTTVSREQHAYARERFSRDAAGERIELRLEDYRDLSGRYDRLVSIEMIEAVGHEFLDDYLRVCSDRLEPDGAMCLQAIVIGDQNYDAARKHVDFIKTYIFPGGCLPSIARIADGVARTTDLRIRALEDITPHYAETLRRWRARLDAAEPELRALGCDDAFLRTWRYYLSYCEAGFEERHIGCVQIELVKPSWRAPALELSSPLAG